MIGTDNQKREEVTIKANRYDGYIELVLTEKRRQETMCAIVPETYEQEDVNKIAEKITLFIGSIPATLILINPEGRVIWKGYKSALFGVQDVVGAVDDMAFNLEDLLSKSWEEE